MSNTESDPDIIAGGSLIDGLMTATTQPIWSRRNGPACRKRPSPEDNGTLLGDREACGERKKMERFNEWVHDREECA